jgi:glycosyltransferase involved in cell wall biosynthesis
MNESVENITNQYELTVLLPTLNEQDSLDQILTEIKLTLNKTKINYCILVTDNGSIDKTLEICKMHNVILNNVEIKGYGANLINALKKIKSEFIIFFDSDGSYDPKEIPNLFNEIKKDRTIDMISGNRLKIQQKNSMPFLNRYIGTPILTFFIRFLYDLKIYDCNSGMRILRLSSFKNINFFCTGMEFASEIFIKSKLNNLKIKEIIINFRKDYRSREPHLSRWSDGWRHLRYIIANSPDTIISLFGSIVLLNYMLIIILSFLSTENNLPRYHTIFSILAINQFFQSFFLGILSMRINLILVENFKSNLISKIFYLKEKDIFMRIFLLFIILLFLELIFLLFKWYNQSFGLLSEIETMIRILIYSALGSFFIYLDLQIESRNRNENF